MSKGQGVWGIKIRMRNLAYETVSTHFLLTDMLVLKLIKYKLEM